MVDRNSGPLLHVHDRPGATGAPRLRRDAAWLGVNVDDVGLSKFVFTPSLNRSMIDACFTKEVYCLLIESSRA